MQRTSVDLPAPLSPTSPHDLARANLEIDILERVQAAEGLAERGDTEEGICPLAIRFTPRAGAG